MSLRDQDHSNIGTFTHMPEDDGSLISPTAVGVKKTPADSEIMSDDEGRVITTLGTPTALPVVSASENIIIHKQTIIKPLDPASKAKKDTSKNMDSLLAKMKSRLSKQIDLKVVTPSKTQKQENVSQSHDTSGSIEIPHDLILSSDIPATPLASAAAAKGELEDHDLIAILEGDDVEITENATEIEVRVGGRDDGMYNEGQIVEEIQISFVDEKELEVDNKEREKEIAMRQMANLPVLPKGRRPKPKSIEKDTSSTEKMAKPISSDHVTIRGQTTIKPIPKPIIVKHEPNDNSPLTAPRKLLPAMKSSPHSPALKQDSMPKLQVTPPTTPSKVATPKSPNELIHSLVSDWDDEPMVVKEEPVTDSSPKTKFSGLMAPPPPPVEELPKRSRVIKKKIIWDPDNPETHMSFASFVKSTRTKPQTDSKTDSDEIKLPVAPRPISTGFRRKRAESVATHMMKDPPYTPPSAFLKRARTPEPVTNPTQLKPPLNRPKPSGPKKIFKKRSEIERLLGDEGAINMLYDVECENSNKDLLKDSDLKVDSDDEDEKLMAKAKIITDAVIKQGASPNEPVAHVSRARNKRASTPQQSSDSPVPTVTPASTASTASRKSVPNSTAPVRKRKQTSASKDWDYVYNSQKTNDDAMIIRRRSNSSYSSSTSPRRLSVDQTQAISTDNLEQSTDDKSNFEFIKPPNKNVNIKLDSSIVADMKGKLSKVLGNKLKKVESPAGSANSSPITAGPASDAPPEKKAKLLSKPKVIKTEITTVKIDENGLSTASETLQDKLNELKLKEITCNICGNYAEISLAPKETKLKDVFTIELMNEIKSTLILLRNYPSVRSVLIRSSGRQFCRGIDVSYLIQTNAEKRKNAAQVLSGHLRNFLQTLASFNKPLVAALSGDVLGLGVTILPLFEAVIASDNATFCTPYAVFGHLPEAMKIFTSTKNLKPKAITDLLYLSKKVSASTAMDYGLVTEVVIPEKLHDKANSIAKKLASLSSQALKSTKISLRQDLMSRLDDQLIAEQKKLTQQWITSECQEKFKQFVSRGGEW